ncbi:MAG: glycogen synthase GlgA [Armatimonadota bacterium]
MSTGLKVLFASAEVVPFAKTGGLADVAGALPKTLADMGHDVRIVMPRYSSIDASKYGLREVLAPFDMPHGQETIPMAVDACDAIEGVTTYFLRNDYLYKRDSLYGQADDDHRFVAYCRGMLEMCERLGWIPDVIHCNDWHTGLVPVYLKTIFADRGFGNAGTLYTIHNLAYQGSFSKDVMELAGLPWELFTWDRLAFWDQFNFMKAALIYADKINTVSETYAQEIQTPEFGAGLEGVLEFRRDDVSGIINGIDYDVWNPETDKLLPANFSAVDLRGKAACKAELQRKMKLPVEENVPVLGLISRLSAQKGLDLLEDTLPNLLKEMPMQVVVLGTGDAHYEEMISHIAKKHKKQVAVALKFDNALAHLIYAGSDAFLMPSHYEPCGLGQLISLAYGTAPIVRATGGLADTVSDFKGLRSKGNGFVFHDYTPDALCDAVLRAIQCYHNRPDCWERVVQNAFAGRFSWESSAKKYVKLYKDASKAAKGQVAVAA